MGKMVHSSLLLGSPEKTGTRALEMAAAILCEKDNGRACGSCPQCRRVFGGSHPDVQRVERLKKDGRLRREIVTEQITDLVRDTPILPIDGRAKVYILPEAGLMNPNAQNAFLKTLEEPPPFVYFILCGENREDFLPTIRSRCAEYRLVPEEAEKPEAYRRAGEWLDALPDRPALLAVCAGMEGLSAEEAKEFLAALQDCAMRRLKEPEKILDLAAFLQTAAKYLNSNVSVKTVMGLLATYGM